MSKKKEKKNWKFYVLQPLSLKLIVGMITSIVAVVGLNIYAFKISPSRVEVAPSLVTQADLMNVLGNTVILGTENKENYNTFFNKPEVLAWQKILEEKPDYPEAYLMIAILAYNDHNCQLAQTYITNANRLDPVNPKIQQAGKIIENCGK